MHALHSHACRVYDAYTILAHTILYVDTCYNQPLWLLPVISALLSSPLVLNQVTSSVQLSHVNELSESVQQQSSNRASTITAVTTHSLYISGRLPTIPDKLACHIQDGYFINMVELVSNNLKVTNLTDDDHSTNTKCKKQDVTQIIDWIHNWPA